MNGMMYPSSNLGAVMVILALILNVTVISNAGKTSTFSSELEQSGEMPFDSDVFDVPPGYNAPQQVHITQGDYEGKGVIVSWVTPVEPGSSSVVYWREDSEHYKEKAKGNASMYKFHNYTSGYIHHCTINNLQYDTKYYYKVGLGQSPRRFWFVTPPEVGPDVPYTFGLIGDLGQRFDSNRTLTHYELNPIKGKTLLYLGDLSYADNYMSIPDQRRWDTWGRFIERSAAYQPWIWTAGNHEIEFGFLWSKTEPFMAYNHRYNVPYEASGSNSPLWYSIKRASAHIIVLSSYSAYGMLTPQYTWLVSELFFRVNRTETPWLIVLMHAPWYNSYDSHYMQGETMRVEFEKLFVAAKVDVVFAGHVHAYERSERISNIDYNITNGLCTPVKNRCAPVYVTLGDGGQEIVTGMKEPQPSYSAFREASYGHGVFDIKNRTHAHLSWHRNQDAHGVQADSVWLHNLHWKPHPGCSTVLSSGYESQ